MTGDPCCKDATAKVTAQGHGTFLAAASAFACHHSQKCFKGHFSKGLADPSGLMLCRVAAHPRRSLSAASPSGREWETTLPEELLVPRAFPPRALVLALARGDDGSMVGIWPVPSGATGLPVTLPGAPAQPPFSCQLPRVPSSFCWLWQHGEGHWLCPLSPSLCSTHPQPGTRSWGAGCDGIPG